MIAALLIILREGLEAALLPTLIEHVWNVNPILDENGALGSFLKALLGYNGNPSLIEVLSCLAYYVVILALARRSSNDH